MTILNNAPVQNNLGGRIVAPDLARGMMLLLIAIANVSIYLWGHETNGMSLHPTDGTQLDRALGGLATVLVDGRVYPMFAFLFGYGMVQFLTSRWQRGVPPEVITRMLRRRHLWLLVFGAVHAFLLFEGDILGAYGLTGLILAAMLLWKPDRALKTAAYVLGAVLVSCTLLFAALLFVLDSVVGADIANLLSSDLDGADTSFASAAIANPLLAALVRIGLWIITTPFTVLTLSVPLCVVLGMLAARHRWLEGIAQQVTLRSAAILGIVVATVVGLPAGLIHVGVFNVGELASIGYSMLAGALGIFGGIGYVALFAIIAQRIRVPVSGFSRAIIAVGKRSLSFYLLQSVLLSPLLSRWGLGLGEHINTTGAFSIAAGVWVLSLVLASLLERRNAQGPAEKLLRKLTYGNDTMAPWKS